MDSDANATSQLSSEFKDSTLEQGLQISSHLERGHSAALPPHVIKRQRSSEPQNAPLLEDVTPVWLEVGPEER